MEEKLLQQIYVGGALATCMVGLCGFLLRRYVNQQDLEDKRLANLIGTLFEKLDKLREDFTNKSSEIDKTNTENILKISMDISKLEGYLNGKKEDKN